MKTTFRIDDQYTIDCYTQSAPTGFKHVAKLKKNNREIESKQKSYYNRTWERFNYESVIRALLEKSKHLPEDQIEPFLDHCQTEADKNSPFKAIATIAKLGEVFADNKEDQNKWKKRMLDAGLSEAGLSFPADWEDLSEEEKEKRLDQVINTLNN